MEKKEQKSVFEVLNAINVNEHTEKKNNLTYLSWAWAWAEVKKKYPEAFYTIYENAEGWNYFTDGRTCWVKTGVCVEGIEHIEYLPVMDNRNQSIPLDKVKSTDVNKAIQRSLTKACARHGLGLYVYAGEDLPETEQATAQAPAQAPQSSSRDINIKTIIFLAEKCGKQAVINANGYNGRTWDQLTDDEVTKLKLWIVAVNKKAGAA